MSWDLNVQWRKYCVLALNGNEHSDANPNNIFTIKLYVSLVTLSGKGNQKLSKFLSKGFGNSVYSNEYKITGENKNMTISIAVFLNQTLYELTDCLFWFI